MSYFQWHEKPGYHRDVVRHFSSDSQLLDIGCGTGWLSDYFPNYVGVDASDDAVEAVRRRGMEALQADVGKPLPFPDASFDAVVMKDLLEHVADPVAVVREARRLLRPGGRVFASSPDAQRWVWDDYTHRRPFTRRGYRLLFADQDFEVLRVGYESVAPGTSVVSGLTRRKRRPRLLVIAAWLPLVRRNVWVLARRPSSRGNAGGAG